LLGDYTYQALNEFFRRIPVDPSFPQLVTLLAGLRDRLGPEVTLHYERGCDWTSAAHQEDKTKDEAGDQRTWKASTAPMAAPVATDPERAVRLVAESDIVIAAMGENRYLCGEGRDREDVRLPGEQEAFVQKLIATGKPVILVVFGGRPMVLTELAAGCRAIVYAWYPGQEGGHAVADLLLGRFNPSGKLTMTLPRSNEQVPVSHRLGYRADDLPLFPFGHGMSYTAYRYADLLAPATLKTGDTSFPVQFEITNTGTWEGVEIAQLYFVPLKREANRPAMELKGFARVALKPGETRKVAIDVSLHQLARHDAAGLLSLRPGAYSVLIGTSSTDIRLRADFTLTGDAVALARRDHFFSQTTVE
jgi:beta-glucosidase